MKHVWYTNAEDPYYEAHPEWLPSAPQEWASKPDIFRLEHGYHNGPQCKVCGYSFCHHCKRDGYNTPCPGVGQGFTPEMIQELGEDA